MLDEKEADILYLQIYTGQYKTASQVVDDKVWEGSERIEVGGDGMVERDFLLLDGNDDDEQEEGKRKADRKRKRYHESSEDESSDEDIPKTKKFARVRFHLS